MMMSATVMHPAAQAGALKVRGMWWRNGKGEEAEFFMHCRGKVN